MRTFWAILSGLVSGLVSGVGAHVLAEARADGEAPPERPWQDRLKGYARAAEALAQDSTHPQALLGYEPFRQGADLLGRHATSTGELLGYVRGNDDMLACLALEVLHRRASESARGPLLRELGEVYHDATQLFFLLHALAALRQPALASVLARAEAWWVDSDVAFEAVEAFARARLDAGDPTAWGDALNLYTDTTEIARVLGRIDDDRLAPLREALSDHPGAPTGGSDPADTSYLRSVGRVWDAPAQGVIVDHDALLENAEKVEAALLGTPARSVLLVGQHGVGKTTLVRRVARRLQAQGWLFFEASATDVLAGQKYIGELEGRVRTLLEQLGGGRRAAWFVPAFHEMLYAGRHEQSPVSLLDMLLPALEQGDLRVVGEVPPEAYEQMLQAVPRLRGAVETVRVEPLAPEATRRLARQWADEQPPSRALRLGDDLLAEAVHLAEQYVADRAAPGHLIQMLELTQRRLVQRGGPPHEITPDDLLATLSDLTGLPVAVLDDRQRLDLDALRARFAERVVGQPEAVDCLVERVAMIKAGLTDPTRPLGVFLFAGPTGTGKTEIAKTLAAYLFGSAERMIRIDMSELQTPESLSRLLGEGVGGGATSLAGQVRRQPFSVILLDEFEKAHPNVWDLFLQVFDDGRLTDRQGRTADFRHSIIILTSNLGAAVPRGTGLGFGEGTASFSPSSVTKAVQEAFRPEFVNRLDRVVVFRPLSRAVMRDILRNELRAVLTRRGLRQREWAVEWDASALEFLLDRGFTADLGARPLKRAIERYLLAPLAHTIVTHQAPEGDQFLFVRGDGRRLQVEFIDPDVPDEVREAPSVEAAEAQRALGLQALVLDAQGTRAEVGLLQERYEALQARLASPAWTTRKEAALGAMAEPGFWDHPDRFATLSVAEYMDRLEAGLATAGSLLERLQSTSGSALPASLTCRLAEQLHLLEAAYQAYEDDAPRDAFVLVEAVPSKPDLGEETEAAAERVGAMYRRWAEARRMHLRVLDEGAGPYRLLVAVSGFGAYTLLVPEDGLHVFEVPRGEASFHRCTVRVRVAPQPGLPLHDTAVLQAEAHAAFTGDGETPAVVRRYREAPSPLVRDASGWRTGRLDRVLGGAFDVMG